MAEMQRTMGNLTPAQMQAYQQQAASLTTDDINRARTQMDSMTPDQMRHAAGQASAHLSAQEKYKLDGASRLKAQGNQLHSSKQYAAAIEKYKQAKLNLTGEAALSGNTLLIVNQAKCQQPLASHNSSCRAMHGAGQTSAEARDIQKACMLNTCSCHLNLGQFDLCAKEGSEVLTADRSNRKALYRRGQAYHGMSR